MASKRKTIEVEWIRKTVNTLNEGSTVPPAMRAGWNFLLEELLFKTKNYNGYNHAPGVVTFPENSNPVISDDSRRKYH